MKTIKVSPQASQGEEVLDKVMTTIQQIRDGQPYEHGKWTISKCGHKFKITNVIFNGSRIVSEKGLQIILTNLKSGKHETNN